jgi:hypothetical protein
MGKQGDEKATVLVREKKFVRYTQLLAQAEEEGRLDGEHKCSLCGMTYHNEEESKACCRVPPQFH